MTVRRAAAADIARLMEIRAAVRENRLNGRVIGPGDYLPYVDDGRCWVWRDGVTVQGFSALDAGRASLWALFVDPLAEGRGIGRALLAAACDDARAYGCEAITLSTAPASRAEAVYARFGFVRCGHEGPGEGSGDVMMRLPLRP